MALLLALIVLVSTENVWGQNPERKLLTKDETVEAKTEILRTVGKPFREGPKKREIGSIGSRMRVLSLSGSQLAFSPKGMKDVSVKVQYSTATLKPGGENVSGQDDEGAFYLQLTPATTGVAYVEYFGIFPPRSLSITPEVLKELNAMYQSDLAVLDYISALRELDLNEMSWPESAKRIALYRAFVEPIVKTKDSLARMSVDNLVLYMSLDKKRENQRGGSAYGLVFNSTSGKWLSDVTIGWSLKEDSVLTDEARLEQILMRLRLLYPG